MRETLTAYFAGERMQGYFWLGVGALMLAVGIWLLLGRGEYRGAGWPLVIIGAVELVVGVTTTFNDGRVAGLLAQLAADEGGFVQREVARMRGLELVFTVMKCVETAIILSGAAMVVFASSRSAWYAVGVGLIVQGAAALTLESVAHRRNAGYRVATEAHAVASAPDVPNGVFARE